MEEKFLFLKMEENEIFHKMEEKGGLGDRGETPPQNNYKKLKSDHKI